MCRQEAICKVLPLYESKIACQEACSDTDQPEKHTLTPTEAILLEGSLLYIQKEPECIKNDEVMW